MIKKFSALTRNDRARLLVYALTLFGAALRLYQLGHFSLWDGEIFTLFISSKPLPLILPALRDFGAHPPMWFLITRAFNAFGWNEWMLRAPAAFMGILALPAMYIAGKRAVNHSVGLLAALLMAVAPIAVLYSQVGRMYAVILPLTALMVYALARALQTRAWLWWFALALFSALIVYNQYLSLLAVGSAYLTGGLILLAQTFSLLRRGEGLGVRSIPREFFRRTARLWASFAAFFILLAPLLPFMQKNFFQRQLAREATTGFNPIAVNADFLRALFLDLAGNEWLLLLTALLIAAGLVLSLRKRDFRSLLILVAWFGLVFATVAVIHPRRFPSRYVLHLVPIYLLLTAHGIYLLGAWLGTQVARPHRARTARAFSGIAAAAFVMLALAELGGMYRGVQEISRGERSTALLLNGGWRELAHYLDAHAQPGDMVVYGGDGALRPPRFIAPYVSAEYQTRAHSAATQTNAPINIWWVGVNLNNADVINPAATDVAPLQTFGDTNLVRATRPVTMQTLPLPRALSEWDVELPSSGLVLTELQAPSNDIALRAEFSAPVAARLTGPTTPVQPGQLFRLSARVRGVSEGFYDFSPALQLQFFNAQGKPLGNFAAQTLLPPDAEGWQTLVLDGAAPANAAAAQPVIAWSDYSFTYAPRVELQTLQWQLEQLPP